MFYKGYRTWIKNFKKKDVTFGISFENLIERINEIYFDIKSKDYQFSHPSIYLGEKERWQKIAKAIMKRKHPLKILDFGTGSGFVPLTTSSFLKEVDCFYCCDISKEILEVAKVNINKGNFLNFFYFIKINSQTPYSLPFESNFFDIITMNSLLHHISDTENFLEEINRIMKKGGFLIIGHEPNKYFYEHEFLWNNFILLNYINILLGKIVKILFKPNEKNYHLRLRNKEITRNINNILLKEKYVKKPLSYTQILLLVDIKSTKGFKPDLLLKNFKILKIETYNHLFFLSDKNFLFKIYNSFLKRIYPTKGATFLIVLRKI